MLNMVIGGTDTNSGKEQSNCIGVGMNEEVGVQRVQLHV